MDYLSLINSLVIEAPEGYAQALKDEYSDLIISIEKDSVCRVPSEKVNATEYPVFAGIFDAFYN